MSEPKPTKKYKLFRLLQQLHEKDQDAFRDFVQSPYFNKNKDLSLFLDLLLRKGLPDKDGPGRIKFFESLFPGQAYQERWLPDLMYYLMKLFEKFLAHEKYRQNEFQQRINMMLIAYEKQLDLLIPAFERALDHWHAENEIRDSNYFYETFLIHSEKDYSFRLSGKISDDDNLKTKSDQLDLFYLAMKLKDNCEILNRGKILSAAYDFKMFNIIIDYLLVHPELYGQHPAINIYLNIYLMLSQENHEHYFQKLQSLIVPNEKAFSAEELQSIYVYAQNYCIRQMNQGNAEYYQKLFDIYKHTLGSGLVFGDNKNMQWDFKNFVSLGLRLKEYDWTLAMIHTFKDNLPENVRQNAYNYNLANYYYDTGEYKKATILLSTIEFTDMYYILGSKAMLLKIYYQVGEEESFYSLVSSFTIYIRRNKLISSMNAEIYNNFIKFTKKVFLLKTKLPYQKTKKYFKDVDALKQIITITPKIANSDWLMEELKSLERV